MKRLHLVLACCALLPLSFANAQGLGNFVDAANYSIDFAANNLGILKKGFMGYQVQGITPSLFLGDAYFA